MEPNRALHLNYTFTAKPDPIIRTSLLNSTPHVIDLEVMISNPALDEYKFNKIQIEIPVGEEIAADLSTEPKLPDPNYDTSGQWKIEIDSDEKDIIKISPKPGETIKGDAIIFTIPGIKINTKPGTVIVTVDEDGTPDNDTYSLLKQPSDFPVTKFWADPATIDQFDRKSKLYWTCDSSLGPKYTYKLRPVFGNWPPKKSFQWNEGGAGVETFGLLENTKFELDVVKADSSGHSTTIGTLNARVSVHAPDIYKANMEPLLTSRFYRFNWLTRNTTRCDLWLDDKPFLTNLPTDTFLQGYLVYVDGEEGRHHFTLYAYGKSEDNNANYPFPDFQMSKSTSTFIPIQNQGFTEWIAITSDGTLAIMGNAKNKSIYLFDVPGRCQKGDAIGVNGTPNRVAITPDNKLALVACDNALIVLNIANRSVEATIPIGDGKAKSIAVTPDGHYALIVQSTDSTNRVSIINICDWSVVSSIQLEEGGESCGIAVTPDSKLALVIEPGLNQVTVIDIINRSAETKKIPVGTGPTDIAITPDGKYALVVGSVDNSITVIDIANRSLEPKIPLGDNAPRGIAISKDGRLALVTYLSIIMAIDIAQRLVVSRIPLNRNCLATGIALTPDDSVILVSGFGGVEFIY